MPLEPGARLGPYEIVGPLGAGGMGEVYRAKDTRLARDVAVKVLPAHLSSQPELKQRLEREARAVSSLNHPNICTLFDVGHHDGIDYKELFFTSPDAKIMSVAVRPGPAFDGAAATPLFTISGDMLDLSVVTQFDVAPDGRSFLINLDKPTEGQRMITLVTSWPSLLKKP